MAAVTTPDMDKTNVGPAALKTRTLQMAFGTKERQGKDSWNYVGLPLQALKEEPPPPRGGVTGLEGVSRKPKECIF